MTAYYFRVIQHGEPNGFVGFVMADSVRNLFWAIDEFVDPYAVEIKTAKNAGYCYHMKVDGDDVQVSGYEFSELEPFFDEDKWKKPVWVTDKSFSTV